MSFGALTQYFIIYGPQKACIIKMPQGSYQKPEVLYPIYINKSWLFDSILDIRIRKQECVVEGKKYGYRCEIASLDRDYQKTKKVFIYNINME